LIGKKKIDRKKVIRGAKTGLNVGGACESLGMTRRKKDHNWGRGGKRRGNKGSNSGLKKNRPGGKKTKKNNMNGN